MPQNYIFFFKKSKKHKKDYTFNFFNVCRYNF